MGVRGYNRAKNESLPVWEEWIEIGIFGQGADRSQSLPVWEEWIEMSAAVQLSMPCQCLFPYGKSGLKS